MLRPDIRQRWTGPGTSFWLSHSWFESRRGNHRINRRFGNVVWTRISPLSKSSMWYRLGDAFGWNKRVDDIGALRSVVDGAGTREVGERLIRRSTAKARARALASSGTATWG